MGFAALCCLPIVSLPVQKWMPSLPKLPFSSLTSFPRPLALYLRSLLLAARPPWLAAQQAPRPATSGPSCGLQPNSAGPELGLAAAETGRCCRPDRPSTLGAAAAGQAAGQAEPAEPLAAAGCAKLAAVALPLGRWSHSPADRSPRWPARRRPPTPDGGLSSYLLGLW